MPSLNWNKVWAKCLDEWVVSKQKGYYGEHWSNPNKKLFSWLWLATGNFISGREISFRRSSYIRRYITPYVNSSSVVLEVGPGGGRWTQFLLKAKRIIAVELNPEFFPYLEKRFSRYASKFQFYTTCGYELDGIENESADFIFSFDCFVHIDPEGIFEYLKSIRRVLKAGAYAVVHYADKNKDFAKKNTTFSDMIPEKMEDFIKKAGLRLITNNINLRGLAHSAIATMQKI